MSLHYIYDFQMLTLSTPPLEPVENIALDSRWGTDGYWLWKTGKRGRPYKVASTVDVPTVQSAHYLYTLYTELIGADPVKIMWAGNEVPNRSAVVLNVEPVPNGATAVVLGHGGVTGGISYGLLRCEWTLLPWDDSLY